MQPKRVILSLIATLFAITAYAGENSSSLFSEPNERIIATQLVGIRFMETTKDGYFKNQKWVFEENEKIVVNIDSSYKGSNSITYNLTIYLTTETSGRYIIRGRAVYRCGNSGWYLDMFVCNSIMPEITNAYNDCVSIEHNGRSGERYLILRNHTNVKLGVYIVLVSGYNRNVDKGCIVLGPNESKKAGGLFVGDIVDYEVHYIERY